MSVFLPHNASHNQHLCFWIHSQHKSKPLIGFANEHNSGYLPLKLRLLNPKAGTLTMRLPCLLSERNHGLLNSILDSIFIGLGNFSPGGVIALISRA